MKFFEHFPQVVYNSEVATNIMCRGKVLEMVKKNVVVYYPYTIKDGDRPDLLATRYYGNPKYTWMLFFANDIVDPLYDWPLNDNDFTNYIVEKYGSYQKAAQEIHHYELNIFGRTLVIDKYTYDNPTNYTFDDSSEVVVIEEPNGDSKYKVFDFEMTKKAVSILDYEFKKNEEKRNIKVIDVAYLNQITSELRRLFGVSDA